jgi:hypothetical protein
MYGALAVAILLFGLTSAVYAQQATGSIRGTVLGAGEGVEVEAVDIDRGVTRSRTTDANGEFRFEGIQTGDYELRVLKSGAVVDSAVVDVGLAATVVVNMGYTEADVEEIIVTGSRVQPMDTSIAESGLIVSSEVLLEMPIERDLTSVAMMAPGVSLGDYRFGGVGNVSFAGASIAENTSYINGLNLTNFRTGVGFSQVPFEFYDTLQVKTGGYSAKYGRSLGGVMNARSKSGSNDWVAGANVYYTDLIDTSPETFLAANDQDVDTDTELNVFLGGPIWKDHLFFYVLAADSNVEQEYAGNQSGRGYKYEADETFWGLKLDGYITENHHLEFTAFSDERTGVEGTYEFDPDSDQWGDYLGDTYYERGGDNWIATYTGDFFNDFQISASYGENKQNRTTAPATAEFPVVYEYRDGFVALGNWTNFTVESGDDTREMMRVDLTWRLGSHTISGGWDSETNTAVNATVNSGGVYWLRDPTNAYNSCPLADCPDGGANVRRRTYESGGSFETNSDAFYIQDVWDINENWSVEVGVRNETFENLNGEGDVFVEVDDQWAPRTAFVWNPDGVGQNKIFGNWGLYYLPIAANTNIRMSGGETYIHDYFAWDGVSVDPSTQAPTNVGAQWDQVVFGNGEVPDTRSTTDRNLEAMYQSEFILGYSFVTDTGIELGIKGIYRELETTIEDVAIDAAVIDYYNSTGGWDASMVGGDTVEDVFTGFHQYVLTNPGQEMDVYIPEQEEYIQLTADQLGYPKAEREYQAVELTFDRPFDGTWSLSASYTWANSEGNHEGYVKSDNGQDDAGITQNFDQPGLTDYSYGKLPTHREHTIKVFGSYLFGSGIRVGTNFFWQSGRPYGCFGVHPTDVFAADYGADSHFCGGVPVPRGSLGDTPDVMKFDLGVQYNWQISDFDILFAFDIFNLFNSANPTVYNEFGETDSGVPDPDFLQIRQYQAPRSMRLSARVQWD